MWEIFARITYSLAEKYFREIQKYLSQRGRGANGALVRLANFKKKKKWTY